MPKRSMQYLLLFTGLILLFVLLMQPLGVYHFRDYIAMLFPTGPIARDERNLLLILQVMMLLVVLPGIYYDLYFLLEISRAQRVSRKI